MSLQLSKPPTPTIWPNIDRRITPQRRISPERQVETFDDTEFERFIDEWVNGYLMVQKKLYHTVQWMGGPGDKGRDIIGWLTPDKDRLDIFQCKHYKGRLTPSDFREDLAKLIYYTWNSDYPCPDNYWIVASKGIGSKFTDLLNNPERLNAYLLGEWRKVPLLHVEDKEISLNTQLEKYVNSFDFSILHEKPVREILKEHETTPNHAVVFGTSLKPRPPSTPPPQSVLPRESKYITKIFEAYSDHLKQRVVSGNCIAGHQNLSRNYEHSRVCFFCAESLREFTKDATPSEEPFDDFINQIHQSIQITLCMPHEDAFLRMCHACQQAVSAQLANNIILEYVEPNDRTGACHVLANQDKLSWVQ